MYSKMEESNENGLRDKFFKFTSLQGKVPATQSLLYAFNTIPEDRVYQDVGLDGLDEQEGEFTLMVPKRSSNDNYEFFEG